MKISTILLTLIISCSLSYGQYYGKDFKDMSQSEKIMMYNSYNKSPALGILYEALLPTAGYAYSGNWVDGVKLKGIQISGLITINWIMTESGLIGYDTNSGMLDDSSDEVILSELGFLVLTQIYSYYSITKKVKKYNQNLYREIFGKEPPSFSLNLQPTYQGANLTLAYKFD